MPNGNARTKSDKPEWAPVAAQATSEAIKLVQQGVQKKKLSEQLSVLLKGWENTGTCKDLLIALYEGDKVPADKKKKAEEINQKLQKGQELLRTMRRRVENGRDVEEAATRLEELLREVLISLVAF